MAVNHTKAINSAHFDTSTLTFVREKNLLIIGLLPALLSHKVAEQIKSLSMMLNQMFANDLLISAQEKWIKCKI